MRKILLIAALSCFLFQLCFLFQAFLYSWILLVSYLQMQQEKGILLNEILRFNLLLIVIAMANGVLTSLLAWKGLPLKMNGLADSVSSTLILLNYGIVGWSIMLAGISWISARNRS